jgi:hypothetical protein
LVQLKNRNLRNENGVLDKWGMGQGVTWSNFTWSNQLIESF